MSGAVDLTAILTVDTDVSLRNKAKLQTIYNIFINTNFKELKKMSHDCNIFISCCIQRHLHKHIQHKY